MLRFRLQRRNIACLSLCHLERSERSRAQACKIAVRMGYGWLCGSLARSWGEGEGEGQLCGAVVCCAEHSVISRGSERDVAAESRRQSARRIVAFESVGAGETQGDTSQTQGPNYRRTYVMTSMSPDRLSGARQGFEARGAIRGRWRARRREGAATFFLGKKSALAAGIANRLNGRRTFASHASTTSRGGVKIVQNICG